MPLPFAAAVLAAGFVAFGAFAREAAGFAGFAAAALVSGDEAFVAATFANVLSPARSLIGRSLIALDPRLREA